jgi:ferredoxin-NADP reductase/MOSC domain-containing protein YiiM/ferredoxin
VSRLISVNVGLPRDVSWRGATVHTAVWKSPVPDLRMVRRLNIDGDGQGDLAGHGGEQRAVMVYQLDSYRHWQSHLHRGDFTFGQFGENFTVEGLPDDEVSIGDRYRIGGALFEVTQPRVTCYRVGIRMDEPRMPSLLVSHRRPGFYLRVLEEGPVRAGDEIVKIAEGPGSVSVAEVDALLYLPGHPSDALERALRVPALSAGWKGSLRALVSQEGKGNAGLTTALAPPPAWTGFRPLRVARVDRESASVLSFSLNSPDGPPLPSALPGQSLIVKLRPKSDAPPVLRNYSLSGAPDSGAYRISVKRESQGVASNFLHSRVNVGNTLEIAAARGTFTLRNNEGPVVLLSAGIGATPVMAMLHASASRHSERAIWWLHGARNRSEHAFALESRQLLSSLRNARSHIMYSRPDPGDRPGRDFDAVGRFTVPTLDHLGVPREADFYICGPTSFLAGFSTSLKEWGVEPRSIHSEAFGPGEGFTPGIAAPTTPEPPRSVAGAGPQVSFVRSGVTGAWSGQFQSLLELAEACRVPVGWSCRTGVCHSCESALVGGSIEYEPEPLDPPAEGNILICCSRPKGDVEIDL